VSISIVGVRVLVYSMFIYLFHAVSNEWFYEFKVYKTDVNLIFINEFLHSLLHYLVILWSVDTYQSLYSLYVHLTLFVLYSSLFVVQFLYHPLQFFFFFAIFAIHCDLERVCYVGWAVLQTLL
jgi:hypothetical protein